MKKSTLYYSYCWANGKIGFGKKIPEGALEIAHHKNKFTLRDIVTLHASDNGRFIVSVRLAYLDITKKDPLDCLIDFSNYIRKILGETK